MIMNDSIQIMDHQDNILSFLFDGKLTELYRNNSIDSAFRSFLSQKTAIVYYDVDANRRTLTYEEVYDECLKLYDRFRCFETLDPISIQESISFDEDVETENSTNISIKPAMIIFGDCSKWTPVFMIFANLVRLPFFYIDSGSKLKDTLLQFKSHSLFRIFITSKNRFEELYRLIKNDDLVVENLRDDHQLLYFRSLNNNQSQIVDNSFLDLAYLIQTSGTTSENGPIQTEIIRKTIFVPHNSIGLNLKDFQSEYKLNQNDSVLICSPFTFDPSICDLFLGLSSYATIIIVDQTLRCLATKFAGLVSKVTYITITPSLWYSIAEELQADLKNNCLKFVNFGGEPCPSINDLRKFHSSKIKFYNLYGLSEMSVWASLCFLNDFFNLIDFDQYHSMPLKGRSLLETFCYLDSETNEIIIESSKRKCLIFDQNRWIFNRKLFTKDIGYEIDRLIFYEKRFDSIDSFSFKLNGIKCYSELIKQTIRNEFEDYRSDIKIINCIARKSIYNQKFLMDLIVIIAANRYDPLTIKLIILKILQKHPELYQVPIRVNLIDSTRVLLNHNGKLDWNKIEKIIDFNHEPEYLNHFECFQSKSLIESNIHRILFERLSKTFEPIPISFDSFRGKKLKTFGLDSLKALEIVLELEEFFQIKDPQLFEILLSDTIETLSDRIFYKISDKNPQESPLNVSIQELITEDDPNDYESNIASIEDEIKQNFEIIIRSQWSYFMEQCVDSTPLLLRLNDENLLIVTSHSGLICCLRLESYREPFLKWSERIASRIEANPVSNQDGNLLFVADYLGFLRCFQTFSGKFVWHFRSDDQIKCTPISIQNIYVLFGSFDKHLYCLRQSDGFLYWKVNINQSSIAASPMVWWSEIDSQYDVIVCTLNGTIGSYKLLKGQQRWQKSLSTKPIFSTPKNLQNKFLVVGITDGRVLGLSLKDGSSVWQYDIGSGVVCLQFGSGILWTLASEKFSNVIAEIIHLKEINLLVACCTSGSICLLQYDGHLESTYQMPSEMFAKPCFDSVDKRLFLGCRDSNVYCLSLKS
ncbi:Beta-alanine-activating enzyme [Sarcoptes scabiei]|uniref:Acyl-CoA synthetase family member 4 n=1 Tax=Sarcoptes scabiei TaxID=52283 RepID=A0A834VGA1_SARSC|nr:Beta-alanine-activating enzyme [Sarcoptes scabiei]